MSYISLAYLLSGVASASIWALVTAAAPPDYIASSGSIQNFGGYVGGTCSPIVTGIIVDVTGSFVLALLIGAGMAVLGALVYLLGPVDKSRPDADASEQDESHEAGGELVISGGDAALLLEMPNETLNP
jgi:MFS family permease